MAWWDDMFGNISRGVEDLTNGTSTIIGNGIANYFNPASFNQGNRNGASRDGGYPFVDDLGRNPIEVSKGPQQRASEQPDFRAILGGKYNSQPRAQDPSVGVGTVLAGLNNNIDPSEVADTGMSAEDQMIADTIRAIQERLQQKYSYDGKFDKMVDGAFAGALGAVDKAESRANSNYKKSDQFVDQLTDAHVSEIQNTDRKAVRDTGANAVKGIDANYDQAIQATQADRAQSTNEQMEAIKRYGLDPRILQGATSERDQAVDRYIGEKATNIDQAEANTTADLQLNTARASAQESDGIERRGELRQDLDKILGTLDNSRAGIQSSISQAKLQGQQADQAAFNDSQRVDADTLAMYMQNQREDRLNQQEMSMRERELAAKTGKANGTGSAGDVAAARLREMNVDPAPIEQAYYDAVSSNKFNSNTGQNMKAWIMDEMLKRLGRLDPTQIAAVGKYVDIKEDYGTDKANAVIQ